MQTLLHRYEVRSGDIAALRYVAPSLIARLVGRPAQQNMAVAYARLCLPYLAARTALFGTVGLDAFTPEALADATVLELAGRITVTVNENPDPAAFTPALLQADLTDGRHIEIPVPTVLGSPAQPLDLAARLRKVDDCLHFAGLALPAAALAVRIDALDQEPDMASLLALACLSPD